MLIMAVVFKSTIHDSQSVYSIVLAVNRVPWLQFCWFNSEKLQSISMPEALSHAHLIRTTEAISNLQLTIN